jgi:hypothetical protein
MLQSSVLLLVLCAGTLVGPFRIAEAEPGHHQTCVRTAMAPDGYFAIAWVDSLRIDYPPYCKLELYIRFFDRDGSLLTDAYKITKMADTNLIYWPCLEMDTAGNVVLVCMEKDMARFDIPNNEYIRFQRFAPEGSPMSTAQTLVPQVALSSSGRPIGLSLANNDEFAIAWSAPSTLGGYGAWVQRFNREGYPKDNAFLAHDEFDISVLSWHPQVALNDAGDLVVTWHEFHTNGDGYPKFQVFDAEDESILPWEPMGHLLPDDSLGGSRVKAYWLDNDRFVLFWIDYFPPKHIAGRVFAYRGLTRYPICRLAHDSLWLSHGGSEGWYSTAVSPNDSFAYTHTRSYSDRPDTKLRHWEHGAGILGYIQDNEPIRRTTLFEYTPPWGTDTVNSCFNNHFHTQPPAVACCDDRIVWVYSRLNTDTIFEAYAMITDWDMGVGVEEQPIVRDASDWEVVTTIGPRIALRYANHPGGFHVTIFDASGRKVDEIRAAESSGIITWGSGYRSGVYFIRIPFEGSSVTQKVILLR